MHYVYLLRCADHTLYVGATSNLKRREDHHNDGHGGSYTAARRPVRLVYAEQHRSKPEALKRERQIKRWSAQKKELLVRGDTAHLSGLSQKARVRTGFSWKDLVELSRKGLGDHVETRQDAAVDADRNRATRN